MAGEYITEADLMEYGITDPAAINLIPQACRIIDLHITAYPANTVADASITPPDDEAVIGWKFPRQEDTARGIRSDSGLIPASVKSAVCEQILWMLQEGQQFIRQGGNDFLSVNTLGHGKSRDRNEAPLLAPLAKLHLRSLMLKVGYSDPDIRYL